MAEVAPPITEAALHASIVDYCASVLPRGAVLHHSPNEGKRGWKSQQWFKSSGVQSGWPDLEIFYHGAVLFLEVKSAKGKVEPTQENIHARLADAGFAPVVVRSFTEAEAAIQSFIKAAWRTEAA